MYIGPGSEETWKFDEYPENPKGKCDEFAIQVTSVYLVNTQYRTDAETSKKVN